MHQYYLTGLLFFGAATAVYADTNYEALLNQVTFQLSAEQWVKTTTPLVTIGIDAAVNDSAIGDIQSRLVKQLEKIASSTEWHITSFERSQDSSGLEKIQAVAEARLSESQLSGLRTQAKAISRPGETYTLLSVAFTPTDNELRAATVALREQIYQQVNQELVILNKAYPEQHYYLHHLNFLSQSEPRPMMMQMAATNRQAKFATSSLPISRYLVVNATANLASAPSEKVNQMVHGVLVEKK